MKLIKLLSKAHDWSDALRQGRRLIDIAKDEGLSDGYIGVRSQLAYLSPKIQKAILNGEQPLDLTIKKILRIGVALSWTQQEQDLGFNR